MLDTGNNENYHGLNHPFKGILKRYASNAPVEKLSGISQAPPCYGGAIQRFLAAFLLCSIGLRE